MQVLDHDAPSRAAGDAVPAIIVDHRDKDDAAVVAGPRPGYGLVLTADVIAPLVDDPEAFGAIAACNALSDVYAMGGEPRFALNLAFFPDDKLPLDVLVAIQRGAARAEDYAESLRAIDEGRFDNEIVPVDLPGGGQFTVDEHPRRNSSLEKLASLPLLNPDVAGAVTTAGNASLGYLEDAIPDTMTLHTRDAYRLFTGRAAEAAGKLPAIPGGRRFAAVLKSIWHLSANDNPYADWILIRMYAGLVAIRGHLGRVIKAREDAIELLRRKGLTLSVMGSRRPKTVELGFRSPYGYATAEAIVEYLQQSGVLSPAQ